MMFSDTQIEALKAPLSREHVKEREQGGRKLAYVESWVVIKEANRIFGFDGWNRETTEMKCVSEREREIGKFKDKGWGVTYVGKVRVTVDGVVREGTGAGHGIDRDLGAAHESAIKECESDAAKRALMTFGNPFGLALYDKEQNEVEDAPTKPKHPVAADAYAPPEIIAPVIQTTATMTPQAWAQTAIERVNGFKTIQDLDAFEKKFTAKIVQVAPLVPDLHRQLVTALADKRFVLEAQ